HQGGGAHHGKAQPDERGGRRGAGEHGQHLPDDQRGQHAEGGVEDRAGHRNREQAAMAAGDRQHASKERTSLPPCGGGSGWGVHEETVDTATRSVTSAFNACTSRGSAFSIGVRFSSMFIASAFALASMSMS